MALTSYMLGGAHRSTPARNDQRKRLRKAPPTAKSSAKLYSCKEILDIVRAQSCLVLFKADEDASLTKVKDSKDEKNNETQPHINLLEHSTTHSTPDSLKDYPAHEMDAEHPRRRRAKTPVTAIGQLERNSSLKPADRAKTLAEQYQALLPPRTFTPYRLDLARVAPSKKSQKLRKIKCQLSLRDVVKQHSNRTHSVAYSDAETLVGSESPTSLHFPAGGELEKVKLPITHPHEQSVVDPMAIFDDDIGLKICVDLLTNELASQLFRQHPAEREDRASGLQILLMIEAYETIQKTIKQKLCDREMSTEMKDHVRSVDKILKYWLKVLYSVYDQSQEKHFPKKVEEDQSLCDNSPEAFQSAGTDFRE